MEKGRLRRTLVPRRNDHRRHRPGLRPGHPPPAGHGGRFADGTPQEKITPVVARTVYLDPAYWETIRRGLAAVVTRGTAAAVFQGFRQTAAGKTGSAETGRGTTHSWFACYAPASAPEVVVAALVEDGGDGSVSAGPVVRKVLEAYFALPPTSPPQPPPGTTD